MNHGSCVEAASTAGIVAVRDSKDSCGPILAYPVGSWRSFIAASKAGELGVFH
jgi:hypothetical protein